MKAIYISGSPRQKEDSNTDYLLNLVKEETGGQLLKLADYSFQPCHSCWKCQEEGQCVIKDDLTEEVFPEILESDVLVLGSPVYFNNVSAQMKTFIDRTWSIKGELRNKIGGAVVVGRKYGAESAITAINAFFLKHEMVPANRGVHGIAFQERKVVNDEEAVGASKQMGKRIGELADLIKRR
ncbi:flavodoxin family protein [Candidatus Bipolaricaulota bacterium]|nr:flavodoxin family protein [Candidatus Bipolaricaulota bacterium]MBS3792359.1 flavodoxin family protein [Candidatus Bipolaricaulota bacterium]